MEALGSFAGAAQGTGLAGEHGLVEKDLSRGEAHNYSMEVRSHPFESAKPHFFDTSSWGEFCDVTLTLKQAWQPDRGGWLKIDDYRCRQAFRHFMNLLNRAVYGSAFRRHGKRLRVLPVLEKGEVRAIAAPKPINQNYAAPDSSAPTREPEMPERSTPETPVLFGRDRSRWRATP